MPCSLAAASVVLGMSEYLAKMTFLMSWSVASAESSESICNIEGAMLWQISLQNDGIAKPGCCFYWTEPSDAFCLVGTIEDLYVFHHLFADVVLLVVVGDLRYDLWLVLLSCWLMVLGDVPLKGVWMVVLVLGWWVSK